MARTPSSPPMRAGRVRSLATLAALATVAGAGYTVEAGDTLTRIATHHGTTVGALGDANGLVDLDRILAGQRLTIPAGTAAAGADPVATAAARADVGVLIESTARAHGWRPDFVKALAWQESGWRNEVVSSAGAVGIMQVLPSTGRFVSTHLAGRELDLEDPADNVLAGVLFLDHLHDLTGGDPEGILAGYNQGLASVRLNGLRAHTEAYIANVLALRTRFR